VLAIVLRSPQLTVSVSTDDQRALSAQFKGNSLEGFGSCFHDDVSNLSGSSERNLPDVLVVGDGGPGGGTVARNDVDHTWWEARFFDEGSEVEGRERCLFGWFEDLKMINISTKLASE